MDELNLEKLNNNLNKELKYWQLCDNLGLERKQGKQKIYQLKKIKQYCDFEILHNPTRYKIIKIYNGEAKLLNHINKNNKYQTSFDKIIYINFLKNNKIYLSNNDLLKLFGEINENFTFSCDINNLEKLGEEYIYFNEMGKIVKKILTKWTKDRLNNMEKRGIINKKKAYRLYSLHKGKHGIFRIGHNIDKNSDIGKQCEQILLQAVEEVVPCQYKNKGEKLWLPFPIYYKLQSKIISLVLKKFNGKYCDLKEIMVISSNIKIKKINKDEEIFLQQEINKEAKRKILNSNSLSLSIISKKDKEKFIEINMSLKPKIFLKELV